MNRRETPRLRRVGGFAGTDSAIRMALGANKAARPNVGATLRGVSGRVEADNTIERAYLTGHSLGNGGIRFDRQLSKAGSTPGGARPSFTRCLKILVISA